MRIVMIGTGYVGLVSGVCLADFGHEIICVDNDATKIEMLNSGEVPIFEPNLKSLINKNVIALKVCKSMVSTIEALGVKIITNNKSSINKYFIY